MARYDATREVDTRPSASAVRTSHSGSSRWEQLLNLHSAASSSTSGKYSGSSPSVRPAIPELPDARSVCDVTPHVQPCTASTVWLCAFPVGVPR